MEKEILRTELKKFTDTLVNGYTGNSTILELLGTYDCINDYVDNQLRERWENESASENSLHKHIVSKRTEALEKLHEEYTHYEPTVCDGLATMRECENGTYVTRKDAALLIKQYAC